MDRFKSSMSSFKLSSPIGVCLSGGPDSFALFHLTKNWCREKGLRFFVVHVDHGIRSESFDESVWLRDEMEKEKAEFYLKRLSPSKKTHEALRNQRLSAFKDVFTETGASALLLAHHRDDLVETFAERVQMASNLAGLASVMQKETIYKDFGRLRIIRPLLEFRKEELLQLNKQGGFISDSSNGNFKFARARIRHVLREKKAYDDVFDVFKVVRNEWKCIEESSDFMRLGAENFSEMHSALLQEQNHQGIAARASLASLFSKIKGTQRYRFQVVENLIEWMSSDSTKSKDLAKWSESGVLVVWRKRRNSFEISKVKG